MFSVGWLVVFGGMTAVDWANLTTLTKGPFAQAAAVAALGAEMHAAEERTAPSTARSGMQQGGAKAAGSPSDSCIPYIPPPVTRTSHVSWCSPDIVRKAYAEHSPTALTVLLSKEQGQILLGTAFGIPVLILVAGFGIGWAIEGFSTEQ
ncbi:MAG: hypothetical protein ACREFP_11325 [Acetobacteraceae bacterium]